MTQDIFAALQLRQPDKAASAGGAVDLGKVEQALTEALAGLEISPKDAAGRGPHRTRMLMKASQRLAAQKAFEEALFVSGQMRYNEKIAKFQLKMLTKLGDAARLSSAIKLYESRFSENSGTQVEALGVRLKTPAVLRPRDSRIFGPPRDTLVEQLSVIPVEQFATPRDEPLLKRLYELRGIASSEQKDFRRRFLWGRAAMQYIRFVERYAGIRRKKTREARGEAGRDADARLLAHDSEIGSDFTVADFSQLAAVKDTGRSLLVVHSHAGINSFWRELLAPLDLHTVYFAANANAEKSNERQQIVRTSGGAQMDFLKVAKSVRTGQHLIRLYPDGAGGTDRIPGTVLGVPVTIGGGASRLGSFAGAASFFLGSRWRADGRLDLTLRAGPVAERGGDRDAFEADFAAFYFACLDEIALGPPEDMIGVGGFWTHIMRDGQKARGGKA